MGYVGFRVWDLGFWASQNEGYLVGVPLTRTVVFWGLYWEPLFREAT